MIGIRLSTVIPLIFDGVTKISDAVQLKLLERKIAWQLILLVNGRLLSSVTPANIDKRFKHFGLRNKEVLVLLKLYDQKNVPQEYITRQIAMDKTAITLATKRLALPVILWQK